jgi:hypothetical protein
VFHVLFISANLISVAKFCSDNNALIEFQSNRFFIKDLYTKKGLAQGRLENDLYRFLVLNNKKMAYVGVNNSSTFHSHSFSTIDNKVELWHHRLGHAAISIVTRVMQSCNVSCEKNKATICFSCQLVKIIDYLLIFHFPVHPNLWNLFTLTFGDLPRPSLHLVLNISSYF